MRKFTFIFLILISSNIYSQEFIKLTNAKKENPTVIFNSNIIGNLKIIDSIEQKNIKEVNVIKNIIQSDGHLNYFDNLSEYGIISIKIDIKIKSKKQSEWNFIFGLKANNPIYVDGYLIQNPNYEISTESIIEIEKISPNSKNNLTMEILNIWTLDKNERKERGTKCGGIIPKE